VRGRRVAAWLLSLPLIVAGSQVAHAFAYRLVYPEAQVRVRDLLSSGHSYLVGQQSWLPLALGVLGGVELIGVGWSLAGAVRCRPRSPVPAWAFALLPLVAFTLQEFLERWFAGLPFPWWFVVQPTYRVGLLLQLPFALLVYLLVRVLTRAVELTADVVGRPGALRLHRPAAPRWQVVESVSVRSRLFATGCLGRGPPAVSVGTASA
jgi:hypothetical protein